MGVELYECIIGCTENRMERESDGKGIGMNMESDIWNARSHVSSGKNKRKWSYEKRGISLPSFTTLPLSTTFFSKLLHSKNNEVSQWRHINIA